MTKGVKFMHGPANDESIEIKCILLSKQKIENNEYIYAIDVENGKYYGISSNSVFKLSDYFIKNYAKQIFGESYEKYMEMGLFKNKLKFVETCNIPHTIVSCNDEIIEEIKIIYNNTVICITFKKISGWVIYIDSNIIPLGDSYFEEKSIYDLSNLITNNIGSFDTSVLFKEQKIVKSFGLVGKCGYSPLDIRGDGYERWIFRIPADNATYQFKDNVLYISGRGPTSEREQGAHFGKGYYKDEQSNFNKFILANTKKVVFGKGITKIGKCFLSDFECLETVVLSSTITEFEKQSFEKSFKQPPINEVYLYDGQTHPFGESVKEYKLK